MESNRDYTVLMGVQNGAQWLRGVLDSLSAQTHTASSILLYDNASSDQTVAIANEYPFVTVVRGDVNIGIWAAVESMLSRVATPYVLCLTDVVLAPDHMEKLTQRMQEYSALGAVQGMLLNPNTLLVDCYGFNVTHARVVSIHGHGLSPTKSSDPFAVFAVEGAAPLFRVSALNSVAIQGHIIDPDFRVGPLGYGDDLDLAWRLRVVGWAQECVPSAVGYHNRSTTTSSARTLWDRVRRRHQRAQIPLLKRQLDWCNVRFTIIKNDAMVNLLKYAPAILAREVLVQGYMALFEPAVLIAWVRMFKLVPRMLMRRQRVQSLPRRVSFS